MEEEMLEKLTYDCAKGDLESVKKIIERGIDINNHIPNPLWSALAEGQIKVAELLLKNGANINEDKGLLQKVLLTEIDIFMYKIENEESHEKEPDTIYTEFLIKNGININSIDFRGRTSLDVAVKDKHPKAERLLRSLGAKTSGQLKEEKD